MIRKEPINLSDVLERYSSFLLNMDDFKYDRKISQFFYNQRYLFNLNFESKSQSFYIKEYAHRTISGTALRHFIREVVALEKINHFFVSPLLGITLYPHCSIITEYYENGTIDSFISPKAKARLSPCQLSIIALYIAKGMSIVHDAKIIHRNLNATTVFLDKDFLPHIGGFEWCHMTSSENPPISQFASVTTTAPELLSQNYYNQKVDVYSFGMLLYQMIENRPPFEGVEEKVIVANAAENKYKKPLFNRTIKFEIQKFVGRLINREPDNRPSFHEIYDEINRGDFLFPGCDKKDFENHKMSTFNRTEYNFPDSVRNVDIQDLREKITTICPIDLTELSEDDDSEFVSAVTSTDRIYTPTGSFHILTPPKIRSLTIDTAEDLEEKAKRSRIVTKLSSLEDPNAEDFVLNLKHVVINLKKQEFNDLFILLNSHLKSRIHPEMCVVILHQIYILMMKYPHFVDIVINSDFLVNPPLVSPEAIDEVFNILSVVFIIVPQSIDKAMFNLIQFLLAYKPLDMITLFAYYSNSWKRVPNPLPLFELVTQNAASMTSGATALKFILIIYNLCVDPSTGVRMKYIDTFRQLLISFLNNEDNSIVSCAINSIANMYDDKFDLSNDVLFKLLVKYRNDGNNSNIIDGIISILLRMKAVPYNEDFTRAVLDLSETHKRATLVILRTLESHIDSYQIFVKDTKWLSKKLPEISQTFKIFCFVAKHEDSRQVLRKCKEIPQFLNNLITSPMYFVYVPNIIKFLQFDNNIFPTFVEEGMLTQLVRMFKVFEDKEFEVAVLLIVDMFARVLYNPEFLEFLPKMALMLGHPQEVASVAIVVFVTLSTHKECHQKLIDLKMVPYFQSLLGYPSYASYAQLFLNNMKK